MCLEEGARLLPVPRERANGHASRADRLCGRGERERRCTPFRSPFQVSFACCLSLSLSPRPRSECSVVKVSGEGSLVKVSAEGSLARATHTGKQSLCTPFEKFKKKIGAIFF